MANVLYNEEMLIYYFKVTFTVQCLQHILKNAVMVLFRKYECNKSVLEWHKTSKIWSYEVMCPLQLFYEKGTLWFKFRKKIIIKACYFIKVSLVDLSTYGGKIKFEFWLSRHHWAGFKFYFLVMSTQVQKANFLIIMSL